PMGASAPEVARRKIEQRNPQAKKWPPASQEEQDGGDALESVGQAADCGVSKLRSNGLRNRRAFFTQRKRNICESEAIVRGIALRLHALDFAAKQRNLVFEAHRIVLVVSILEHLKNAFLLVLCVH